MMDEDDDDVTYHPVENVSCPRSIGNSYVEDDINDDDGNDDDDDKGINNEQDVVDDDDDDDDDGNGVQRICNDEYEYDDGCSDLQSHPKKKRLKTLISSYEFAPRVPAPSSIVPSVPRPSYGGRNPLTDWTEHETLILLDAWGERFLKQGRKSLRSEEWQEVAEKVSQESKIERTDTQCRNRLDTLKKKYKKEKMKLGDTINNDGNKVFASEWVHFKKMDALLSAPSSRAGLSCGVDSGEFVFMNPKDYLSRSNGLDEMRDSPGNSESTEGEEDGPKGLRFKKRKNGKSKSFELVAESFRKFSDIYEKIERSKRQQMAELEKMRMDFHRDLEVKKREILERAQAEIARIRQGDDNDDDDDNVVVSAENVSG